MFLRISIDKYALNAYNIYRRDKMKRKDLIKLFEKNGWYFKRNGGGHDIYTNGTETEPIPRHREINEQLAKALIRKHGLK